MYFRNYALPRKWLQKCLNSPVLEDPSTSNMVNGTKHCSSLNNRTSTILIDYTEGN